MFNMGQGDSAGCNIIKIFWFDMGVGGQCQFDDSANYNKIKIFRFDIDIDMGVGGLAGCRWHHPTHLRLL